MTKKISDAPANLAQFHQWRREKNAYVCDDHYLDQVNRKWSRIGKLVAQPASLRGVPKI